MDARAPVTPECRDGSELDLAADGELAVSRPKPEGRESAQGCQASKVRRRDSSNRDRSGGRGARTSIRAPETGCANVMASACSAWRGQASSAVATDAGTDADRRVRTPP